MLWLIVKQHVTALDKKTICQFIFRLIALSQKVVSSWKGLCLSSTLYSFANYSIPFNMQQTAQFNTLLCFKTLWLFYPKETEFVFGTHSTSAIAILTKFLTYDQVKKCTCSQMLLLGQLMQSAMVANNGTNAFSSPSSKAKYEIAGHVGGMLALLFSCPPWVNYIISACDTIRWLINVFWTQHWVRPADDLVLILVAFGISSIHSCAKNLHLGDCLSKFKHSAGSNEELRPARCTGTIFNAHVAFIALYILICITFFFSVSDFVKEWSFLVCAMSRMYNALLSVWYIHIILMQIFISFKQSLRLCLVSTVLWDAEDGTNIFFIYNLENMSCSTIAKGPYFFGTQQGYGSQHDEFSAKVAFNMMSFHFVMAQCCTTSFGRGSTTTSCNAHSWWLLLPQVFWHHCRPVSPQLLG